MSMFGNIVYKDGEVIDSSWIKWFHWGGCQMRRDLKENDKENN